MLILSLDTTGKRVSCALARDGLITARKDRLSELSHSRTLLPECEALLSENGVSFSDIDLFAATVGPGSFTGIRIGVAAVKGFAFPEGKPCAGVDTLTSAAYSSGVLSGVICAAVRARENEYYAAFFKAKDGKLGQEGERAVLSGEETAARAKEYGCDVYLCGEGSEELLKINPDLKYTGACQSAAGTARAAYFAPRVRAEELTPVYMKPSQAERLKKETKK
ncbi:MAG: tRNA (adenosine(37)-N6)-threonylcarbamoyltransferase complex dimerization subunit type 1 TsaB [Clostridia bacterium]|nr:tRNA (adenosine(37)-N6)-threonylcarbamoyltransferase complex dimerization subunit type 1 TsaB [Clostridia bacterium]